jgi:hypothetical protein
MVLKMNLSKCPVCGWEVLLPVKKWVLKGGAKNATIVAIYECLNPACEHLLRTGKRKRWREIKSARA